jgi:hypothetical protein
MPLVPIILKMAIPEKWILKSPETSDQQEM